MPETLVTSKRSTLEEIEEEVEEEDMVEDVAVEEVVAVVVATTTTIEELMVQSSETRRASIAANQDISSSNAEATLTDILKVTLERKPRKPGKTILKVTTKQLLRWPQ